MLADVDANLVRDVVLAVQQCLPRHRVSKILHAQDEVGDLVARFDLVGAPTVHCVVKSCWVMPDLDRIPGEHDPVLKVRDGDHVLLQYTNDISLTAHGLSFKTSTPHVLVNVSADTGGRDPWEIATWLGRVAQAALGTAQAA